MESPDKGAAFYKKKLSLDWLEKKSSDQLALSGRACTASPKPQEKCATPTHLNYDRFSATPACQKSLFSNRFLLSTPATAYVTHSPLLTSLKLLGPVYTVRKIVSLRA